MKATNLLPKIEGIIVPTVTPLLESGKLDLKGIETITRHLIDGGVHGIFILGTTGETPSLKVDLRKNLIKNTCQYANNEKPVMVGISDPCMDVSLELAQIARSEGATAVVALSPFFFHLDQEDLYNYFSLLADQCELPLFLYNYPNMTKCHLEVGTVKALAAHPNIIGIKDSSGNGVYLEKLLEIKSEKPEFSVLPGPEEIMVQSVIAGADGGVNGGANLFPELYVRLYEAAKAKDWDTIQVIQPIIMEISSKIYGAGKKSYSYFQGMKQALSFLGICQPHLSRPLLAAPATVQMAIQQDMQSIIRKIKAI
ncbi:dihydrodipicolinate synthase family protein [Cecembia rubra]|uniref:4-hydroxy-tetrahydrodipicolinate synthase n=1 Tax=Cecembia rubra TaxID=1485585 RepID=A0A2P8DXJ2_9BACT|nr:dihydrodipicolinate synthase family protein [Cecembia rubra]PSL01938.1 4-hydroxy-tetrahydrodipicolinate synthase [Cecembia rubra]